MYSGRETGKPLRYAGNLLVGEPTTVPPSGFQEGQLLWHRGAIAAEVRVSVGDEHVQWKFEVRPDPGAAKPPPAPVPAPPVKSKPPATP